MAECNGKYFICNGEIRNEDSFDESIVYEGESVYEVIRLINGIPLFFSDHCERLERSVRLRNKRSLAGSLEIKRDILKLVKKENAGNINIKIVFNYRLRDNYLIYLIHSSYPTEKQIALGVKGTLVESARSDPESKLINRKSRAEIADSLLMEKAFEAILVNKEGFITEGSRSNVFLIKDDIIYTAPDKMVLSGVTRKYFLGICARKGIDVRLEPINKDRLSEFSSVFMTGTSPGILPFCCIDKIKFITIHNFIPVLRAEYNKLVEDNLRLFQVG
jgi:branched-chain amino acid aminotransferase